LSDSRDRADNDHVDLDRQVDRLLAALEAAGAPSPAPPVGRDTVAAFEKLLAPLELPRELRQLWERVNPGGLQVAPFPNSAEGLQDREFADPAFSWWGCRRQIDDPGLIPEILFCVSRVSSRFRFVELGGPHGRGGTVYEWQYGGSDFRACFASIASWLAAVADELEDGPYRTIGDRGEAAVFMEPGRYAERTRLREAAVIGSSADSWPEAWRAASRLFDARRRPRPADRSVSELLWAREKDRVEGTVAGVVERRLWSERGTRVFICDGTGLLDAWCDAAVSTEWMLRRDGFRTFEADVVVGPDLERIPSARIGWVDHALDAPPPQAHITALRPFIFG
jgi:hypothetical protein